MERWNMIDISTVKVVQGHVLIEKFGDSPFTEFSSDDSYGNTFYHSANELDPMKYYLVKYNRNKEIHPIQEIEFISDIVAFNRSF